MLKLILKDSVDHFKLGNYIYDYLNKYNFEIIKSEKNDIDNWDTYKLEDIGIELFVEEYIIVSIVSRQTLYFNNFNLIGLTLEQFILLFNDTNFIKDMIYLSETVNPHFVYDFDSLGLQIWILNNVIDCIFINSGE